MCRQTDQFADNRCKADCEAFAIGPDALHWGRLSHYCVGHRVYIQNTLQICHTPPTFACSHGGRRKTKCQGQNYGVRIVDIPTAVILRKVQAHEKSVRSLHFDATRIFSVGNDGLVVITDITTGDIIERFWAQWTHGTQTSNIQLPTTYVLILSVDGKEILSVSQNKMLHCYFDRSVGTEPFATSLLERIFRHSEEAIWGHYLSAEIVEQHRRRDFRCILGNASYGCPSKSGGIDFRQNMFRKKEEMHKARVRKERLHRLRTAFKLENDLLINNLVMLSRTSKVNLSLTRKQNLEKEAAKKGKRGSKGQEESCSGGSRTGRGPVF